MGNRGTNQNQTQQSNEDLTMQLMMPDPLALNLLIKKPFRVSKEYQFLTPPIGKGMSSEIRKVINKKTGIMRAMKIIEKQPQNSKEEEKIQFEIKTLERLDHPYILKINEYFVDDRFHYIITDYYSGGELFTRIEQNRQFTEEQAAKIMHQLFYSLNYCHNQKIIHRDIRPDNIVFDKNSDDAYAMLIDFGSCCQIGSTLKGDVNHPYFQAPELQFKQQSPQIDAWSCGILLYVLLCGYPPFRGKTDKQIKNNILKQPLEFDDLEWSKTSNEAKEFIKKLLHKDPSKRISCKQALKDPWMLRYFQMEEISQVQLRRVCQNMIRFKPTMKLQEATVTLIVLFLASREELSELRIVFDSIDSKQDGIIDNEELLQSLLRIFDADEAQKYVEEVMPQKYLTFQQFQTRAIDRKILLQKNKVETAFKLIDRNSSGTISVEELKEAFRINSANYKDPWGEVMSEVDINHDGSLSLVEFNQMMKKLVNADDR